MFDKEARIVMDRAVNHELFHSMKFRWHEDTTAYPPQLLAVVWLSVKKLALEYIDEVCPEAWYRPMLVN